MFEEFRISTNLVCPSKFRNSFRKKVKIDKNNFKSKEKTKRPRLKLDKNHDLWIMDNSDQFLSDGYTQEDSEAGKSLENC